MLGRTNSGKAASKPKRNTILDWTSTLDMNYSDINEIPESDMLKLMDRHISADYLYNWMLEVPEDIAIFTANESAMECIGLRDYVCDKLMSIPAIKSALLASDNWEYILKDKVPMMTSDTIPSGTCFASQNYSGRYAYYAFNGDDSTNWLSNSGYPQHIGYIFEKPICIKRVKITGRYSVGNVATLTCQLQGSNDGSTWYDIGTTFTNVTSTTTIPNKSDVAIDNNAYYIQYRVNVISSSVSEQYASFTAVQFYGRSLSVSVPKMTSDTQPSGEVSASSYDAGGASNPFKAFDGNANTAWVALSVKNEWIQYKFSKPKRIEAVAFKNHYYNTTYMGGIVGYGVGKYTIQFSDDGVLWTDVTSELTALQTQETQAVAISNNNEHLYVRMSIKDRPLNQSTDLFWISVDELNFFGVDYSEHETAQITLTVEGAKGDNITITDEAGTIAGTVIMSNDQTSKEVTLTIEEGGLYTFTSSVAKAIDNSGNDYSKTIALSSADDHSLVKIMPDGAIRWSGNEVATMTAKGATDSSTAEAYAPIVSYPTNNTIKLETQSGSKIRQGIYVTDTAVDLSKYSTIKIRVKKASLSYYNQASVVRIGIAFTNDTVAFEKQTNISYSSPVTTETVFSLDVSDINNARYIAIRVQNGGNINSGSCLVEYSDLWLE